ncbi:MAG: TetR family transcriptional regulator [Micromonosporaceae bacterium]|nr:TetR family transcriptional regulator [Micromonosporaceae bacterium]
MPTVLSGRGDPARTLALLWRPRAAPARGPRPALTVDRIVAAAIELADADGLPALTMRRVADRLGVGTMSLYTYLPGKPELVDLMLDTVYGETARPVQPAGPAGWRAALTQVAQENWALCQRHPWMLDVAVGRPLAGPNETAKFDYELRTVDGIGLTELEMDAAVRLVLGHVSAAARSAVEKAQLERLTGQTHAQWWREHAPLLAELVDPDQFPTATRVGEAVGAAFDAAFDPGYAWEFGLQRILDGLAALVQSRGYRPPVPIH